VGKAKEFLWQNLLADTPHDSTFALADSFPLPVCLFARAYRCRRFKGEAAFGKNILSSRPSTASACTYGSAGQGHYSFFGGSGRCPRALGTLRTHRAHLRSARWRPQLPLARDKRRAGNDGHRASGSVLLQEARSHSQTECSVEPFLLPDRYRFFAACGTLLHKRVWARDLWHLMGRLLRKVLSHTVAFLLNHQTGNQPLQLSKLLV
jgi:hypothetical protein